MSSSSPQQGAFFTSRLVHKDRLSIKFYKMKAAIKQKPHGGGGDGDDGEGEGVVGGGGILWVVAALNTRMWEKQKKDKLKLAEQQLRRMISGHDHYVEQAMW